MSIYYLSTFNEESWEKDNNRAYEPEKYKEKSFGAIATLGDFNKELSDNKWIIDFTEFVNIDIKREDYSATYKDLPIYTKSIIDLKNGGVSLSKRFGYGLFWKKGGGRQIIDNKIGPLFSLEISGSAEYLIPYTFENNLNWEKWGDILKKIVIDFEGVGRLSLSGSNLEKKIIKIGKYNIPIPEILGNGYIQSFKVYSEKINHIIEVRRNGTINCSSDMDTLLSYIVNEGLI